MNDHKESSNGHTNGGGSSASSMKSVEEHTRYHRLESDAASEGGLAATADTAHNAS